ncbi:MAG: (2Fe-2S)-binding protein [Alphaproteobacteria bacterium]|nr:(2Fe-2S)-binding protein [Alphaproteobacteria bacterium]
MTHPTPYYRRLAATPEIEIVLDGTSLRVPADAPVLPSLMALGIEAWSGRNRQAQPLCLMGACFQCTAVVDGRPGQRLCRTPARQGMSIGSEQADG